MFTRADELSRLIWLLLIAVTGLLARDAATLALLFSLPAIIVVSDAKLFWRTLSAHWKVIFLLPACLVIFQILSSLVSARPLVITLVENNDVLVPAGRVFFVVLVSLAFIEVTDPRRLTEGLTRLGIPYKWAFTVYLSLQYVHVLQTTARDIRDSMTLRMRGRTIGFTGRLQLFSRFVLNLVVASVLRADRTAVAMQSRGFGLFPRRTFIRRHRWTLCGILLCASTCVWTAVVFLR